MATGEEAHQARQVDAPFRVLVNDQSKLCTTLPWQDMGFLGLSVSEAAAFLYGLRPATSAIGSDSIMHVARMERSAIWDSPPVEVRPDFRFASSALQSSQAEARCEP